MLLKNVGTSNEVPIRRLGFWGGKPRSRHVRKPAGFVSGGQVGAGPVVIDASQSTDDQPCHPIPLPIDSATLSHAHQIITDQRTSMMTIAGPYTDNGRCTSCGWRGSLSGCRAGVGTQLVLNGYPELSVQLLSPDIAIKLLSTCLLYTSDAADE